MLRKATISVYHFNIFTFLNTLGIKDGGAENDRHENDSPSELQDMKMQDMTKCDKCLFIVVSTNPSNFSSIVENLM